MEPPLGGAAPKPHAALMFALLAKAKISRSTGDIICFNLKDVKIIRGFSTFSKVMQDYTVAFHFLECSI